MKNIFAVITLLLCALAVSPNANAQTSIKSASITTYKKARTISKKIKRIAVGPSKAANPSDKADAATPQKAEASQPDASDASAESEEPLNVKVDLCGTFGCRKWVPATATTKEFCVVLRGGEKTLETGPEKYRLPANKTGKVCIPRTYK